MTDSLEKTSDCPVSIQGGEPSHDEDRENVEDLSELHWEDGGLAVEIQKGLETLRVNRELTDVVLCVQGHDFPCHRAILAAASQYFR